MKKKSKEEKKVQIKKREENYKLVGLSEVYSVNYLQTKLRAELPMPPCWHPT